METPQKPSPGIAPFSCRYTPQIPELLLSLKCTVTISTYQAGKVVFISPKDEHKLIQLPRTFSKPMGIAEDRENDKLAIACKDEVVLFKNSKELAFHYPKSPQKYDSLYMPRVTYNTGTVDVHDLKFGKDGRLFAVNTLFSCIATLDEDFNFTPYWKPPFIDKMAAEDRCHLNGMALVNGVPKYATAFNQGNSRQSWRENITKTGVIFDLETNQVICQGLGMPHSPTMINGELYLLLSATGEIVKCDVNTGEIEVIKKIGGFVRGMSFYKDYLFIGLSKLRKNSSTFAKLEIAKEANKSGVVVLQMKINHFGRIERQLSQLKLQLEKYLSEGASWSDKFVNKIVTKIKALAFKISNAYSLRYAKHLLGAFSFLLLTQSSTAQNFADGVSDPFNVQVQIDGYAFCTSAANLDGDGDVDLLTGFYGYDEITEVYNSGLLYYENIGTAEDANFAEPILDPFGLSSVGYISIPEMADIDGDGDIDVLVGGYFYQGEPEYYLEGITYFENIGSATEPMFAPGVVNPFNINPLEIGTFIPEMADIDGDGDLDLLGTSYEDGAYGMAFFENVGDAQNPNFADPINSPSWFSNADPLNRFGDIDLDGDLDAVMLGYTSDSGFIVYSENIGTPIAPDFGPTNSEVFSNNLSVDAYFPELADMDNDGDLDVVGIGYSNIDGQYGPIFLYYENLQISISVEEQANPSLSVFPNPASSVLNLEYFGLLTEVKITNALGQVN